MAQCRRSADSIGQPIAVGMSAMKKKMQGQAMLLVALFLLVLMVSLLSVMNISVLSREKMEAQNAADAVAYSAALLEARHLNFTAYTNRAMMANEVAIGQSIGLATWLQKWSGSFASLGSILSKFLGVIPIIGSALAAAVEAGFSAVSKALNTVSAGVATFAEGLARVVAGLNKFYGYTQLGFRVGTFETILVHADDLVEENAPGAQLFTGHELLAMYHAYQMWNYNVAYKPTDALSRSVLRDDAERNRNREGMRRMAGAVNASRDLWTRNRYNDELGAEEEYSFRIPFLGKFGFRFKVGMFHAGGSTLRVITGGGSARRYEHYNWSAMDTNEFKLGLGVWLFSAYAGFELPIPLGWGTMQMAHDSKRDRNRSYRLQDTPSGGTRLGRAGYKANYGDDQNTWDENPATSLFAAPGRAIYPWKPPVTTKVKKYGDLQAYHDIETEDEEGNAIEPPVYLAAVMHPADELRTSDNLGERSPRGEMDVDIQGNLPGSWIGGDGLMSIGAAQVYYARVDGIDEAPNTFSPYWQARLTGASNEELMMALLMHEPQLAWQYTGVQQTAGSIVNALDDFKREMEDRLTDTDQIVEDATQEVIDEFVPGFSF